MELNYARSDGGSADLEGARKISSDCGGRLWVPTHDSVYAAGLIDDIALADPDAVGGRPIDASVTILEMDTPEALGAYLAQRRARSAA